MALLIAFTHFVIDNLKNWIIDKSNTYLVNVNDITKEKLTKSVMNRKKKLETENEEKQTRIDRKRRYRRKSQLRVDVITRKKNGRQVATVPRTSRIWRTGEAKKATSLILFTS